MINLTAAYELGWLPAFWIRAMFISIMTMECTQDEMQRSKTVTLWNVDICVRPER